MSIHSSFFANENERSRRENRALLHFIVLPTILLTAGLLGGLRIDGQTRQFVFIAPPLVTLVLAILFGIALVRAGPSTSIAGSPSNSR